MTAAARVLVRRSTACLMWVLGFASGVTAVSALHHTVPWWQIAVTAVALLAMTVRTFTAHRVNTKETTR